LATQFDAQVRRLPEVVVLDLHGDINSFAERALNEAYAQADADQPAAILLNFADVSYINSTGIALIVGLLAKARASGRRLLACGLSDHYVEIFNITRLADFMTLFPDENSALTGKTAPEGAA
jgi:anti-sigma B factor antagonist